MATNGHKDEHRHDGLANGVTDAATPPRRSRSTGGGAPFSFSPEPSFEEVRRLQAEFTAERRWERFHQPRSLLLALVGEVGELAELFQWRPEEVQEEDTREETREEETREEETQDGAQGLGGPAGWSPAERERLGQELSDVLIYLLELADRCRVDLPQAVLRKMALNRLKYPAGRVQGSAKKYTEYHD